jgi:hypothetical protein
MNALRKLVDVTDSILTLKLPEDFKGHKCEVFVIPFEMTNEEGGSFCTFMSELIRVDKILKIPREELNVRPVLP